MTTKPENPSAFPVLRQHYVSQDVIGTEGGMTLRDYFAAAALQGMMPNSNEGFRMSWEDYAGASYALADAMLAARILEQSHD